MPAPTSLASSAAAIADLPEEGRPVSQIVASHQPQQKTDTLRSAFTVKTHSFEL